MSQYSIYNEPFTNSPITSMDNSTYDVVLTSVIVTGSVKDNGARRRDTAHQTNGIMTVLTKK
jgi:hypothetical protein